MLDVQRRLIKFTEGSDAGTRRISVDFVLKIVRTLKRMFIFMKIHIKFKESFTSYRKRSGYWVNRQKLLDIS